MLGLGLGLGPHMKRPNKSFRHWLAGVIDGDGNFDLRKIGHKADTLTLKAIRIKVHERDIKLLKRIQNQLHMGRVVRDKRLPYCTYIISTQQHMRALVHLINGLIRLKVPGLKKACIYFNIDFIKADYLVAPNDPYFAGLVDSDGSIILNYPSNRVECNLELKRDSYSEQLCLDLVIPDYKPSRYTRLKTNQTKRVFESICFKYQTVSGMPLLYDYFMKCRLFCEIKFYRVSQIRQFLIIRHGQRFSKNSPEFQRYAAFLINFIKYQNPSWQKTPWVKKLKTH